MLRSPSVSLNRNPPSSGGPLNVPEPHRTMAAAKRVGWVERSDTHQLYLMEMMGFAGSTH